MGHTAKTNDGESFEGGDFQDILAKLEKFCTILNQNKKSVDRLKSFIAKIQTSGSFSSEEWRDIIDDLQILKGLEYSTRRLNDLFLTRLDNLSKLRKD